MLAKKCKTKDDSGNKDGRLHVLRGPDKLDQTIQ